MSQYDTDAPAQGHPHPHSSILQKMKLKKKSAITLIIIGRFWPYHKKIKGHPSLIILTKVVDLESPMLYTTIQPQSILSTEEEAF